MNTVIFVRDYYRSGECFYLEFSGDMVEKYGHFDLRFRICSALEETKAGIDDWTTDDLADAIEVLAESLGFPRVTTVRLVEMAM